MNYKYKFDKYTSKVNSLLGGFLFTQKIKDKITNKIIEIIEDKKLMNEQNPSLQEIIFNDQTFIKFNITNSVKYFLIDDYGNLIDFNKPKEDEELLEKIMNQDKILEEKLLPDLEDLKYDKVIENQIYLGLLYSNKLYIQLFDLELISNLNVFTRTIVEMVLDKIKS